MVAISTMRPAYMTQSTSVRDAIDPQVMADQHDPHGTFAGICAKRSIRAEIVTSRAVVGSSASSTAGSHERQERSSRRW